MRAVITICAFILASIGANAAALQPLTFETATLTNKLPKITIELAYRSDIAAKHPVILMLGSVTSNDIPYWSTNLLNEGYMLAAFTADYPTNRDATRRAQWLYFDQRFAHSYVEGAQRTIKDTARVIDHLEARGD